MLLCSSRCGVRVMQRGGVLVMVAACIVALASTPGSAAESAGAAAAAVSARQAQATTPWPNTSVGVHSFLTFDSHLTAQQRAVYASRYTFVWGTSHVAQYRASNNPGIILSHVRAPCCVRAVATATAPRRHHDGCARMLTHKFAWMPLDLPQYIPFSRDPGVHNLTWCAGMPRPDPVCWNCSVKQRMLSMRVCVRFGPACAALTSSGVAGTSNAGGKRTAHRGYCTGSDARWSAANHVPCRAAARPPPRSQRPRPARAQV